MPKDPTRRLPLSAYRTPFSLDLCNPDDIGPDDSPVEEAETPPTDVLRELTSSGSDQQRLLVADPRFHRKDVLQLLLALSKETQLTQPQKAREFASLAAQVAELAMETLPMEAPSALVRAHCLVANAYRLTGLIDLAEDSLGSAFPALGFDPLDDRADRAIYCRTLALVRWEQGRLDEAVALLPHARSLLDDSLHARGRATCSLLEALLQDEIGSPRGVLHPLSQLLGKSILRSCPPWLTSRAFLTFAAVAAKRDPYARAALEEGLHSLGFVTEHKEQLRLFRLEGRARGRLGFTDEAEQLLEAVRREHLETHQVVDLTLATLDLLALRTSTDQDPRIEALYSALTDLPSAEIVGMAVSAIDRFISWVAGDEEPWEAARSAGSWFLRRLRFAGIGPDPIPFA